MNSRFLSSLRFTLPAALIASASGFLHGQDLLIDFNSTTHGGGPNPQAGYQSYDAGHEIALDFTTQSFAAFGATIDVTPAWPNTTNNRVQQMIDRGADNDVNWNDANSDLDLVTDWLGIDTRTFNWGNGNWDGGAGGTPTFMTLTIANLPAGTYGWTSFHHDTENVHTNFQIELSTDGGNNFVDLGQDFYMSDSRAGGNPDSATDGGGGVQVGPDANTLTSTATFQIESNGVDEVVLRFAPLSGALGSAVHNQLWGINGFQLFRTGGAGIRITEFSHSPGTDELTIRWESKGGKLYNVRSVLDPSSADPPDWPLFDPHEDIVATPPENSLVFPRPADVDRYFVVEEFNAPPVSVFSEDFEGGPGAWTAGADPANVPGTVWEFGLPDPLLFGNPPNANSGSNCFGINLDSNYTPDALVFLRSPAIDLTVAGEATLSFFQWRDIEVMFDAGTINVLDAADDSFIVQVQGDIDGSSIAWERFTKKLPPEALGKMIKIEFLFDSDNIGHQAGWYIDDFLVTVP